MKHFDLLKISVAVLFLSLSSCTNDQDEDGVPDDKDKCKNTAVGVVVDKDGCPIKERKLGNIRFYIETSASMAGYMNGATEFVQTLPNLLVDIENRVTTKRGKIITNFIAEKLTPYLGDVKGFTTSFATQNVANEKSSPMDKTFELITSKLDTSDIAIFVSECIFSGTNEQIKNSPNRDFNLIHASGLLSANIRDAFSKIKKQGYAANIYGFNSKFFGTYYNYRNEKLQLNGEYQRPYYIWIIGNSEMVSRFTDTLKSFNTFKPELEIEFGKNDRTLKDYTIVHTKFKSGKWRAKAETIEEIKPVNGSVSFAIVADLSSLPRFAQEETYLKDNIKISGGQTDLKVLRVSRNEVITSKDVYDKKVYKYPHVIIFSVSKLVDKEEIIQISLPYDFTNEYEKWSSTNDIDKSKLSRTTFGFKFLIEAVKGAYSENNKDFFKYSITLKK